MEPESSSPYPQVPATRPYLEPTPVFLNICFLRRGVVSTSSNPQAGGPSLVGCPRLLIQFIHSYPPYWRSFLHPQPEDAPCPGDKNPHSWTKESILNVKWKFTLQVTKALRGSRLIGLLFPAPPRLMWVSGHRHSPATLPPGSPGNHCEGGKVGPRAGVDEFGKSCPQRNSIPEPSSP